MRSSPVALIGPPSLDCLTRRVDFYRAQRCLLDQEDARSERLSVVTRTQIAIMDANIGFPDRDLSSYVR